MAEKQPEKGRDLLAARYGSETRRGEAMQVCACGGRRERREHGRAALKCPFIPNSHLAVPITQKYGMPKGPVVADGTQLQGQGPGHRLPAEEPPALGSDLPSAARPNPAAQGGSRREGKAR